MEHHKITQCIESLCQNGCDAVNATIRALENDLPATGTEELASDEKQLVLDELRAIMAVYQKRNG